MTRPAASLPAVGAGLGFAFAVACGFVLDLPWVAVLPAAAVPVLAAVYRPEWALAFLFFAAPLSINLEDLGIGGVGLYLPTEPVLALLLVLFAFRAVAGDPVDRRVLRHPVTLWIAAMLLWTLLTSISSVLPAVSFKFLIARLWFVVGFYLLTAHFVLQRWQSAERGLVLYLIPLAGVVIYTVMRHADWGFDKDAGHWVMTPFFKDHTSYGAVLAMCLPAAVGALLVPDRRWGRRGLLLSILAILVLGTVLSYTRAAWVSLAGAATLLAALQMRISLRTLVATGLLVVAVGWAARDALVISLERNRQDSSDNLAEHVESISNVSSDASNLERLNRWSCALALFTERPLAGWGPGTYQFVYAPFQRSEDRTIISTNNADGGNAHSEYLGPLAEQGLPGALFMVGLLGWTLHLGFRLRRTLTDVGERRLATGLFLGLMTYFIHGVLNNYLDTDKASALFWGFLATLVALDLRQRARSEREVEVGGGGREG
jgi:O-antigen ligase